MSKLYCTTQLTCLNIPWLLVFPKIFRLLFRDFVLFFRKVKKGTLLIDSSTIDPAVSKEMAVAAEKMGAVFMDAPVSGGMTNLKTSSFTLSRSRCLDFLEVLTVEMQLQCYVLFNDWSVFSRVIVVSRFTDVLNVSGFVCSMVPFWIFLSLILISCT